MFRAAPTVARAVPNVTFRVAGAPVAGYEPGPPPPLENGGRIETMYSYVSNDQTASLFERAQVVVCPYTNASQSGVVLTAFAFGCPVVATDAGGLPEYVADGVSGLVVPAGDDAALAGALIRCLSEPELLASLRAGVEAATATELNWRQTASELTVIYADVARRAPRLRRRSRFARQR